MKTTLKRAVLAMVGMGTLAGCSHAPLAVMPGAPMMSNAASIGSVKPSSATKQSLSHLFAADVTVKLVSRLPNSGPSNVGPVFADFKVETTPTSKYNGKFIISFDTRFQTVPAVGSTIDATIDGPVAVDQATKAIVDYGTSFLLLGFRPH